MGKTQLAEPSIDVKKPAAGFLDSKPSFQNPEDIQEMQEELNGIEKKRQRDQARSTKVSAFMKDNFFRTDKTWPCLFWNLTKQQLSVRYFFPRKNLAIDQFKCLESDLDKMDAAAVAFKRKVLKENKIKYFPMFRDNRLIDLAEYI